MGRTVNGTYLLWCAQTHGARHSKLPHNLDEPFINDRLCPFLCHNQRVFYQLGDVVHGRKHSQMCKRLPNHTNELQNVSIIKEDTEVFQMKPKSKLSIAE